MSLENHYIAGPDGVKHSFAELRATRCIVVHQDGEEDSLTLTIERPYDADFIFTALSYFYLFDPIGTVRFFGFWTEPQMDIENGKEVHVYVAEGPSYWLRRYTYGETWNFPTSAVYGSTIAAVTIPRATLHLDIDNTPKTARQMLLDAIGSANSQGANIEPGFMDAPPGPYLLPTLGDFAPPDDLVQGLKCGEVIKKALQWMPYVQWSWRYVFDGPPLMLFYSELKAGNAIGLAPNLLPPRVVDPTTVIRFTPAARYDLLVSTMRVHYMGFNVVIDGTTGNNQTQRTHAFDQSLVPNGAIGTEEYFFEAAMSEFSPLPDGRANNYVSPINNLAKVMHGAFADLYWDMTWSKTGQEVDWSISPGEMWTVAVTSGPLLGATGACQTITRDIGAATTRVKCGPPRQIGGGFTAHRDLRKAVATRRPVTAGDKSSQKFGMHDKNPDGSGAEYKEKLIEYCNGGANVSGIFRVKDP